MAKERTPGTDPVQPADSKALTVTSSPVQAAVAGSSAFDEFVKFQKLLRGDVTKIWNFKSLERINICFGTIT